VRKLQERGTLLTGDLSSNVLIWKAVGNVGKQMHSPRHKEVSRNSAFRVLKGVPSVMEVVRSPFQ
jgi:hypothetical protein